MDQLTKLNKLYTPDKFNYAIYGCTKKFHPFYLWYLSNYKHHKESWENLIFLLKLLASLVSGLKNTDKNNQTYTNFHTKSLRGELIYAIIIESYFANYILNPDIEALEFLKFFRFFKDLVKGQHKYCKYVRTTAIKSIWWSTVLQMVKFVFISIYFQEFHDTILAMACHSHFLNLDSLYARLNSH